MIQAHTKVVPRLGLPLTITRLDMDWSAQLLILLGVCEEYQSSVIGVARLCAAIRRERDLDAILQPSLAEMRDANQSLRQEVLGLLGNLAGCIENTTADVESGR